MKEDLRIIELVSQLAPAEGYTASMLAEVSFMRANRPLGRTPVLYEPSIVLVCQGSKRGFLGDEVFVYDEHHFLVLSVPLPFSTETEATAEKPLLAVSITLDPLALSELMLVVDSPERRDVAAPKGLYSTPVGKKLSNALLRLLEALANQLESKIVAPLVLREILFLVLTGEQGDAMRASLRPTGDFHKIAKALRRIHSDFADAIDIRTLSNTSGMSVPTFHRHFKAVTQTTPIQYLKSARLHQARLMMIRTGITAAGAALAVGYDSPSQFSREFKREFGKTPGEEASAMRTAFSWSAATSG
jgi:AraC-like DNA-binding protein